MMVAIGEELHNLHRLELLQTSFLGNLILTLIGIVLKVTDVRYVAYVANFIPDVGQVAEQNIERDSGSCMPQMSIAVHSWSAHVHTYMALMQGTERLLRARERIIEV